ncbi:MAG: winged helix-turn-helix transcriptional regulator, partial [Muribaculaceae bacterium]|nr:winged helix-turn-helix transcriptional regulator [Muribaculaceae bacterium]
HNRTPGRPSATPYGTADSDPPPQQPVLPEDIANFQRQSTPNGANNDVESRILALIGADNKISLKEITNQIDVPGRTLDRIITSMKKKGIIKRVGSARSGHWEIIID